MKKWFFTLPLSLTLVSPTATAGVRKPLAIYHAFDMQFRDVEAMVCNLKGEGYNAIQIAPAQKSNTFPAWWARYQPFDYSKIEGRGSDEDLKKLTKEADNCGVQVIADVVFNHMQSFVDKDKWNSTNAQCQGSSDCNALENPFIEATNKFPQFQSSDF